MNAATLERPPVEPEILADGESENLASKTLAEFSQRQAFIASMQQRFAGLVSLKSLSTPAEYESTRLAIAELRTFRVEVDKRRKVLNADAQAWIKSVNGESKRLIAEAEAIENPLQAMKDAADAEKERKRAELAEAQRKRLEAAAQAKIDAENAAKAAEMQAEKERLAAEQQRIDAENAKLAAERKRIEETAAAERAKLDAEKKAADEARRQEESRQQAARDELARQQREWQEKIDAAAKAEREKVAEAERLERLREQEIQAAKERAEREAREAKEAEERAAAEAARREAMKPDIEKVREFGAKVLTLVESIPVVISPDATNFMDAARDTLLRMGNKLSVFGA